MHRIAWRILTYQRFLWLSDQSFGTLSLLEQVRLVQGKHIHLNLIQQQVSMSPNKKKSTLAY